MDNVFDQMKAISDELDKLNIEYEETKKEIIEKEKEYEILFNKFLNGENVDTTKVEEELKEIRRKQFDTINKVSELKKNFKNLLKEKNKEDLEKTIELDQEKLQEAISKSEDLEKTLELDKEKIIDEVNKQGDSNKSVTAFENEKIDILFDSSKGWYNIKLGDSLPKIYSVDKTLLDENNEKRKELINKYGNLVDVCLIDILENYDKQYNSNLVDKYIKGNLKPIYDFRKFRELNKEVLNTKEEKKFKKMIKKSQNKYGSKVVTIFSSNKLKKAAITFGLITGGAVALTNNINTEEKKEENQIEILSDDNIEEIETLSTEENKEENIEVLDENIETKRDDTILREDYKIGDKVNLNNIDIFYTSLYDNPMGNTSNINSKNFQISIIAVTYGSEIVDVIRSGNESINSLREKYEKMYDPNINIAVNVNVLDDSGNVIQKNVGWFNSDKLYNSNENIKTK